MKKWSILFMMATALYLLVMGCGKTMEEKDYFDQAYKSMGEEKWSEAETSFQTILDQYPEGEFYAKALFMVGFINANYLKNYEKARKYYEDFLAKYPDHDLADDAKYEIANLGKSIDELPFLQESTTGTEKPAPAEEPKKAAN